MILNRSTLLLCVLCLFVIIGCSDKETDPPAPPEEEKPKSTGWSFSKVSSGPVYDVNFPTPTIGYFASTAVYKTIDGGVTWNTINSPQLVSSGSYDYCYFLNATTGWLVGNRPRAVYRTVDGGDHWELTNSMDQLSQTGNLSQIKFIDEHTGFIVTESGLFKSTNGGISWTKIYNSHICTSLFVLDQQTVWVGEQWGIASTKDGVNFTKSTVGNLFFSIQFFDKDNGLALDRGGQLYQTNDGGINWQPRLKVELEGEVNDMHFFDKENGYIAGTGGVVKITGNVVKQVLYAKDAYLMEMFFTDPQHGFVGSVTGELYRYVAPK